MGDPSQANTAQREYWNAARQWVDDQAGHDDMLEPLGRLAQAALAPAPGERILDIGCGTGTTIIELAGAVGPSGAVVGADVSALLLEVARQRASATANISFIEADAQVHPFEPGSFDGAFSRFGVMFFDDAVAAFANIRAALRPGGRLAFVCWQAAERNEWVTETRASVRDVVNLSFEPDVGPGPFAFADENVVRSILDRAGFADISVDGRSLPVLLGGHGDVDTALGFVMTNRFGRQIIEAAGEDKAPAAVAAMRRMLGSYATPRGVEIGSAVWVVTAQRP